MKLRTLIFLLMLIFPAFSWWDLDWNYRRQFILSTSDITSTVYNYPVIISIRNGNDSILHYSFDGKFSVDSSPNGYDGTVVGSLINSTGVYGYAVCMDGSQYIDSGDILNFSWNQPFSIFVWVKTNSTSTYNFIVSKQLPSSPYTGYAFFLTNGQPQASLVDSYPTMIKKTANVTVNDGNWHLIGFTYDGSGSSSGVKIYIDGVEASSYSVDEGTVSNGFESTAHFKVGNRGSYYFVGCLDDLMVFNYELSSSDVSNLYNGLIHGGKMNRDYSDVVFAWYDVGTGSEYTIPQRMVKDGVFWVKIPVINPASTTSVFVYYGNPNNTINYNNDEAFKSWLFQSGRVLVNDFNWVTVNFTHPFDTVPVVVATVEFTGDHPNTEVSRVRDVSRHGFRVRAEPYDGYSAPNPYYIYWIALPNYPRVTLSDNLVVNVSIVHVSGGSTTTPVNVDISPDGVYFHQLQSYNEVEAGSHSRFDPSGPNATVEECVYQADHVEEDMAILSFPEGLFTINDGILYISKVNTNDKVTVSFPERISGLVSAIAKVSTMGGAEPVDAHVESVLEYQMTVNMDESPCVDGSHAYEDIGFIATNVSEQYGYVYANPINYTSGIEETQTSVKPSIYSLLLTPSEPKSNEDITCTLSTTGSVDQVNFKWYVNGVLVNDYNTTSMSSTISNTYYVKHDTVTCEASIYSSGVKQDTKNISITVRNTPPTIPTTLQPELGIFGGENSIIEITCGGSTDVDNDQITYKAFALCCRSWSFIGESTNGTVYWNISGLPSQENVDLYCKACDNEDCSYSYNPPGTLIIDNDAPETTSNIDTSKIYNTPVSVSLYCIDNVGCNSTYYCIDQSNICYPSNQYNSTFNITSEGINYVRVFSDDSVGNKELVKSFMVRIDYTPPSITVIQPNSTVYESEIPINISVSDNFGVDYCLYDYAGSQGLIPDCENVTVYGPAGNNTLKIYAYDIAGNYRVVEKYVYLKYQKLRSSGGGGGGGGGISYVTVYVKTPIMPKIPAKLCVDKECKEINPENGTARFNLPVFKYTHSKVVVEYGGKTVEIPLKEKYGFRTSLLVDVGKELGIKNALYRQKRISVMDENTKFVHPLVMVSVALFFMGLFYPFVQKNFKKP